MKNLILIPIFIVLCSMISLQAASAQAISAATDSSHIEPSQFSHQLYSNRTVQNLNQSWQSQNPDFDSKAFSLGVTFPRMKIYVPDPTLTASMPIFKPRRVDPGIFIPKDENYNSDRQN